MEDGHAREHGALAANMEAVQKAVESTAKRAENAEKHAADAERAASRTANGGRNKYLDWSIVGSVISFWVFLLQQLSGIEIGTARDVPAAVVRAVLVFVSSAPAVLSGIGG